MKACTVAAFCSSSPAVLRQHRCVRVAAAAAPQPPRGRSAAHACQQQSQEQQQDRPLAASRRSVLMLPAGLAAAAALATLPARPAAALIIPPSGYRYHVDKLDGYSFFYPEDWQPVTVRGSIVYAHAGTAHACLGRPACDEGARAPCARVPLVWPTACAPAPVRRAAADLWQRRVLPQPLQRGGEPVCECLLAVLL